MSPLELSPFLILNFVPSGCCIIGEAGEIVFWNQTLEDWTGRTAETLVGQNLFETFPQLAHPRFKDRILGVLATGAPTFFSSALNPQFFPCNRGSRPRIQQTSLNRLPSTSSTPLVLITVNDVTDQFERGEKYRSARSEALKEAKIRGESEELYRLVVGLSSAAILIGSTDGSILDCNPPASQIFHYTRHELTQRTLPDLFPYKHANLIRQLLKEEVALGTENIEIQGKRQNGTVFPADITAKFFTASGQRRYVAYIHDITDRKRAEEALRYAHKQESLGVLAGGIAHDFNNLFGGVLGNLELARTKLPRESEVRSYMERIRSEILRASELSRKMLAFSGMGRFSVTDVDLNRLLEEMKPQLSTYLSKKAQLRCRFTKELSSIEADPVQIQQVVEYLVINAAEALGDEEGTIDLITGTQDLDAETIRRAFPGQPLVPGHHITLEVADTGCGISSENLPRIFDPFFSTKFAGRGLSLAVAQGILRGHNAGFAIASNLGVGTRFKLFFPAVVSASSEEITKAHKEEPISGYILLVDDEPVLREATQELLEELGYQVWTACDGQEAVECYQAHGSEIALVLMDLTMPRMDGRQAFKLIRQMDPNATVILSSGFSENDAILQFQNEGLTGFLPKPYRLSQLEAAISPYVTPKNQGH